MWKKWLGFAGILTLIILLDPTHTPGQPPGFGKGFGKGGPGGPGSGGPGSGMSPGSGGPGSGGMGYGRPRPEGGGLGGSGAVTTYPAPGSPGSGGMGSGMGGPGMGSGGSGMGGPGRTMGSDPERSWAFYQRLTNSTGDTIDLSKIPPESRVWLKDRAERSGALPIPESGVWTKDTFLQFHAKNEAAKAAFAASGGSGSPSGLGGTGAPGGPMAMTPGADGSMGGRGMRGMGDPNGGWGQGGWNQGGWGQGGWGQGGWDPNRQPFEKKETEEEKPVAMRYGKLPKDLPSWYDELDLDKDGQVSLYEWRKGGKDTKEFTDMDLNGDGLVTADEYLRFARLKDVGAKVKAYEDSEGADRPKNWGLGAPVDAKGDGKGEGGKGKWGGMGGWPPRGGGDKGGDKGDKGDKGDRGEKGKGNPWGGGKRP